MTEVSGVIIRCLVKGIMAGLSGAAMEGAMIYYENWKEKRKDKKLDTKNEET